MDYKPKTVKKVSIAAAVLVLIGYLRIDTALTGENYWGTAFFILIGLALIFSDTEEKDEEIQWLRYEMENLVNGSQRENEEARSYAYEKRFLLQQAKAGLIKKYGTTTEQLRSDTQEEQKNPRSYDPFYISDKSNPNRHKLMKDGNVDVDKK